MTSSLPSPAYPLEKTRLDNGLRVVLAPDATAPVVAVAVHYDVGFRSEPEGRTGFAHLFEHMMFQGSENVGKAEHPKYVQAAGGIFNGSTHPDHTDYYELLPAGALELALFLEADRMRAPKITRENLDNQIAVVQEEIRVNVMNRPYGGFPWITLPPVAFDTFPNAHNGYGDFSELEAASLDDAEDFFEKFYAPGNAVLTIAGDFAADDAMKLVERYFGDIAARAVPERRSFAEPVRSDERRDDLVDKLAPRPALAIGYRVPDPDADLSAFLAHYLLTDVLTSGDASRLERRLVQADRSVIGVSSYVGTFGDPFDQRDPLLLTVEARHPAESPADGILAAIDEELDRLATDGLADGELERIRARVASGLLREADDALGRALAFGAFELHRGRPETLNELPALLSEVTGDDVAAAAAALRAQGRSVLELKAGAAS
ncbi:MULTISPECIES: pitrilysin family protein [unclassified Pseudofrankia]|uniref:M16 family metallopeptidase n=1 Tax=unclassified Pseudofrankia TaxID=2994372 RepID=UPI0008DA12F2|nr:MULTISPECIES: pitrilysin family protein [unclassified Pseudofrankia]MDT3441185.1 pitrilysin family protein [Pseudofrankia sp. BMG5.37]OHV54304.1 peptidase M16 [Pseudofrankia sp. BMG5.36]